MEERSGAAAEFSECLRAGLRKASADYISVIDHACRDLGRASVG